MDAVFGQNLKKILLVEDSASSAMLVKAVFENAPKTAGNPKIVHVETLADALKSMERNTGAPVDVVLLDLTLPDSVGLETLTRFREQFPDVAVVVLTGTADEERGFEAVKYGAQDFLFKDETYPKLLVRQSTYARQRKLQELAYRDARDKAEALIAQKDQFVSMVTHDLRSPLSAIIGLLSVLDNMWDKTPDSERHARLQQLQQTSRGMLKVVENLLDISRLQRGLAQPQMAFLAAHYLIADVCDGLSTAATLKNVTLKNHVPTQARIYADSVLFGQVLQNLIGNAIKFSHAGGVVEVSLDGVTPGTIVVRDHGVGIAPDRVEKLFGFTSKNTTLGTAGEKGTGLGLPHSIEIMKSMGGTLSVTSVLGEGSGFHATLPVRRPKALVIDDQVSLTQFLQAVLSSADIDVATANSAHIAFEKLVEGLRPDLIVVDVNLPDMGGLEVLRRLKHDPVTATVPVIVVTGDTSLATRETATGLGASDFVTKPLAVEDFLPRVRRFLG